MPRRVLHALPASSSTRKSTTKRNARPGLHAQKLVSTSLKREPPRPTLCAPTALPDPLAKKGKTCRLRALLALSKTPQSRPSAKTGPPAKRLLSTNPRTEPPQPMPCAPTALPDPPAKKAKIHAPCALPAPFRTQQSRPSAKSGRNAMQALLFLAQAQPPTAHALAAPTDAQHGTLQAACTLHESPQPSRSETCRGKAARPSAANVANRTASFGLTSRLQKCAISRKTRANTSTTVRTTTWREARAPHQRTSLERTRPRRAIKRRRAMHSRHAARPSTSPTSV